MNFPAGVTQQNLGLRLFLPERADEEVRMDKPLEFWALTMDETQVQRFQQERIYPSSEIEQSRAGRIRLVMMPRGVGRIEVSAVSLFSEIQTGESVETSITIRNTGTRRLENIKLTTEHPLNWRIEVLPDIVSALEINREAAVKLRILPPARRCRSAIMKSGSRPKVMHITGGSPPKTRFIASASKPGRISGGPRRWWEVCSCW